VQSADEEHVTLALTLTLIADEEQDEKVLRILPLASPESRLVSPHPDRSLHPLFDVD